MKIPHMLSSEHPLLFKNHIPQVSEIGPPHDKTYEYQLKMGDLASSGRGKNKKDAKTKAAENMVLKLEDLPKV